ncbi:MAG: hypothetical protein ACYTG0_44715 [Planctomycetota bacterium]|jgi:hypothetical protein
MPNIDKRTLLGALSPPLDHTLTEQMLDEFLSIERRYALRDWEPATLDGGQFAEASARLIYHQDSGNLSRRRAVNRRLEYIEDPNNNSSHAFPGRKSSLHLCKVIRTVYKFRSDRGAVHIDPDYSANQLDSRLVIETTRWILSEILRVFWQGDRTTVAAAIREIVEFDVPIIGQYDGRLLVQRTDCTTEEEILLLLYQAGEEGLSRRQLGDFVQKDASGVTRALKALSSTKRRQVILTADRNYRLTDLGIKRVMDDLSEKLHL